MAPMVMSHDQAVPARNRMSPAVPARGAGAKFPVPVSDAREAARLLVVDDEPDVAHELVSYLERHGYACTVATCAKDALRAVASDEGISIVITDICMDKVGGDNVDGLSMLRDLSRRMGDDRDVEYIVLTGAPSVDRVTEALRLGAIDFLPKPIRPKELLAAVLSAEGRIGERAANARDLRTLAKEKARLRSAFAHYVGTSVVERIEESPGEMGRSGTWKVATFLFTDIADYTQLTEKTDPKKLVMVLNAYLDGLSSLVLKHGGQVDKFVGDAMVAIFEQGDERTCAAQAVACAMALDSFADDFRKRVAGSGTELGVTRIGVHTGSAFVGTIGGRARYEFTGIGDAVNVAARLEAANKELGTRICVSQDTAARCPEFAFRPLGDIALKGKTGTQTVLTPLGRNDVVARHTTATDRRMASTEERSIQQRQSDILNDDKSHIELFSYSSELPVIFQFLYYMANYINYNLRVAVLLFRSQELTVSASARFVASTCSTLADSIGLRRRARGTRSPAVRNP